MFKSQTESPQKELADAIVRMAYVAELKEWDNRAHLERIRRYCQIISSGLELQQQEIETISLASQLHDVGKMSVDGKVLRKNGPLDDEERTEMNRHPVFGFQILSASDRLQMAAAIALNHHERWDGTGYPDGRRAEEIPIEARIVALADIYDALRSPRPYKPGYSHEEARKVILEGDDRMDPEGHLDPQLTRLFAEHHGGMAEIWDRLAD